MVNALVSLPESIWLLLGLGLAAGVLSAALGVGSGVLLVPALALIVGLSQKSAQGTALAVMVPMALVGVARYLANPEVDISLVRVGLLAVGAMVGALLGAYIASRVSGLLLRRLFAVFLVVVALRMLWAGRVRATPYAPAGEQAIGNS